MLKLLFVGFGLFSSLIWFFLGYVTGKIVGEEKTPVNKYLDDEGEPLRFD